MTRDAEVNAMLSQIGEHLASRPRPSAADEAAPDSLPDATWVAGRPAPPPTAAVTVERLPRRALGALAAALLALVVGLVLAIGGAGLQRDRLVALGQTGAQAQRLVWAADQAQAGQSSAFADLADGVQRLRTNAPPLQPMALDGSAVEGALAPVPAMAARAQRNAEVVLAQRAALERAARAGAAVAARLPAWSDALQALASEPAVAAEPAHQIAAHQLSALAQRIARQVRAVQSRGGLQPDAAMPLGADLQAFQDQLIALQNTLPAAARERLDEVAAPFAAVSAEARVLIGQIEALRQVQVAYTQLAGESVALQRAVDGATRQVRLGDAMGLAPWALILAALLALGLAGGALWRSQMRRQSGRANAALRELDEVGHQEREAQRINDANQAAIVRLMNELQVVAAGDLTQQATVTEDITGAIADTINYTVDELRTLLVQVQQVAARVMDTTQQVEATSTELLAASGEQLREIQDTGQSVLGMAGRINEASGQAQAMAAVAQQSLAAADTGRGAVGATIAGMNRLREQIQDTAKRLKRLGESSQEIGEITELISGITEQTNVLALNAAIQAASAGEAGRGFSPVAEEVQRLAERSADATRAIAALVKTIQGDTLGAMAAMEQSTQGVVQSARLADAAGSALADIGRVTRELSVLIAQIEADTRREADSANVVATHIQHIFAVTEQTSDGTRSTASTVHELARMAQELRQSVDRFKIS
ncbi:MAG: methyl-accepting chemotaxis protein [Proteobacteria bacterium]|nr:methyl-accepting chemotaxis protein [Pseudomonadota bacterium]